MADKRVLVLIVEDEPIFRRGIERELAPFGFELVLKSSLPEGNSALNTEGPFDLLIFDGKLGAHRNGGLELAQFAHRRFSPCPPMIFYSSGTLDSEFAQAAEVFGAQYVRKEVSTASLGDAVRKALQIE